MAKKIIIKKAGSDQWSIVKKDKKSGAEGKSKRKRSAADGFSLEIPPKKPVKTKPKNNNDKKE